MGKTVTVNTLHPEAFKIIDASPVPFALNDEAEKITYLNPAFIRTFGYDLNDISSLSEWWPIAYPDPEYRQWVITHWQRHLDKARQSSSVFEPLELNIRCKNGDQKTVIGSAASLTGSYEGNHLVILHDISERVLSTLELNNAYSLLENVINSTPDLIFVKNKNLQTILCNSAYARAVGKNREDMYGNTDIENGWDPELIFGNPAKGIRGFMNDDKDALSGLDVRNPYDFSNANGEIRIFDTHKLPLKDHDDRIIGVLGVARDITKRKLAEEELKRQQKLLIEIAANYPNSYLSIIKKDLTIGFTSGQAFKKAGLNPDDFIGQSIDDIFGEHLETVKTHYLKTFKGEECSFEIYINGQHQLYRCIPLYTDEGSIEQILVVAEDISERKQAENELIKQQQEQQLILDTMIDAVITIDEKGIIQSFNRAGESMFGINREEAIGRNIRIIMPEPDASQHDDHIQRYLRTGQAHVIGMGIEMQAVRKNGETFPMRLSIAEFSDARPGEKRFIASCHDTTVEKQQEEQLRRSQKMDALGKLTGGIAHDFNNMLSVILGYAELLQQKLETDNNLHRYITEIRTAGNRARKLTSKLLTFSRHQPSDARPTDINNLLKNFQHMLERTLTARIKLQLLLQQNLWLTYIDQELLGDAILNMAINAMHAMPEGGTLSIETRNTSLDYTDTHDLSVSPGEFVTLLITDTGCGMDEKIRAQIFEPFFTTKGELGTGLGMSQVYGFVKQAHGDMRVFSTPGQGSQFRIYIPRYHENARTDIISGYTPTKSTPRGHETILVVDDEASLVDLAKEILNLHEYKVLCADNGKRALEILAQQPVDLLFTDIIMPDINGYMLAKQVEMHYPHTRILMTSGYSDDLHADITNASLHKERLQKPYNAETLLRRVREILDRTA